MVNAQGREGALELGMSIQTVGGRAVAKERQAIGVKAGWQAILFDDGAQVAEVIPRGIAGDEGAAEDFAGVIIQGQNERGIVFGRPPIMEG